MGKIGCFPGFFIFAAENAVTHLDTQNCPGRIRLYQVATSFRRSPVLCR